MTKRKARAGGKTARTGRSGRVFLVVLGVAVGALGTYFLRGCARAPESTVSSPTPTRPTPHPSPRAPATSPAPLSSVTPLPRPTRTLPSDFELAGKIAGGALAIVIDDVGFDPPSRGLLASLEGPLALAVIPGAPHGTEAARLAEEKGWDLLVHLPMDPEAGRSERDSIGPKDDDAAIRSGVLAALARYPGALGVNNHQGSKATADARVMRAVLSVLKDKSLFFLDSRTTSASVADVEARTLGVPFLARDVFLDDAATEAADPAGAPGALESAWTKGLAVAKKTGQAIVIGHPHKETLVFLSGKLAALGKDGPTLVRVSELVP